MRLRNGHPEECDLEFAENILHNTTKIPLVVYRGISKEVFRQMLENAKNINGIDLYEKAFLYTSLVKGFENPAEIYLRIFVPANTPAIYSGNVNYELERFYELVIATNYGLKIVSADNKYINCLLLKRISN